MDGTGDILITALALILVIEGAVYALFPEGMKRMMAMMQQIPAPTLRAFGMAAAATGVVVIWIVRFLAG